MKVTEKQADSSISFRRVQDGETATLARVYHFRYRIVSQRLKWVNGDWSAKEERDEHDPHSFHYIAERDGALVGYMRLTPAGNGNSSGLMTLSDPFVSLMRGRRGFHALQLYFQNKEACGDITRLILENPRDGEAAKDIFLGLWRTAYRHSKELGVKYWYFDTSFKLLYAMRRKYYFPVGLVGWGKTPDNKWNAICLLDLEKAYARLLKKDRRLLSYFEGRIIPRPVSKWRRRGRQSEDEPEAIPREASLDIV